MAADAGYQGVQHQHPLCRTPHKASKKRKLDHTQEAENLRLARFRIAIEHVIRRLKIFRVLKETYRHRRKRFSLRVNLIAAICNHTAKCA
ncbi:transposase family protein [Deinococcus marmoris]|uniref:transposase family protein n=1 Tax=Deinococcus marmoris TaxID=249408 RepID=UPI00096AB456|nr:transposase family protein [Deinococcus marmoris]